MSEPRIVVEAPCEHGRYKGHYYMYPEARGAHAPFGLRAGFCSAADRVVYTREEAIALLESSSVYEEAWQDWHAFPCDEIVNALLGSEPLKERKPNPKT